jgi:hypothetical protein
MEADDRRISDGNEIGRLVAELEAAEAYEQKLRQLILEVRDHLAAGHTGVALSLLNQALTFIDNETDVVAPSPVAKEPGASVRS